MAVNIDLAYLMQPLVITIASLLLVIYCYYKRTLTKWVFLYSFIAYFLAIAVKAVFQHFTIPLLASTGNLYYEGLYFGLQTVILEIGLAYVFAKYAISKKQMSMKNASGYGIGLAFWENGVLLGIISMLNILVIYSTIASGGPASAALYNGLLQTQPGLFLPASRAFVIIALGTLERASSFILHFAWGYIVLLAAFYRKRMYLAVALPMGLVDFIVVFVNVIGTVKFELILFGIAMASLAIALYIGSRKGR
ncbi:MAG: YhfC family intramembrane metalloprotease [Candidatus Micrarchaeota archaeon]|nr:YhfC family intramembrane metalloprotease [Candidatus Micrarchaeota archaeon]